MSSLQTQLDGIEAAPYEPVPFVVQRAILPGWLTSDETHDFIHDKAKAPGVHGFHTPLTRLITGGHAQYLAACWHDATEVNIKKLEATAAAFPAELEGFLGNVVCSRPREGEYGNWTIGYKFNGAAHNTLKDQYAKLLAAVGIKAGNFLPRVVVFQTADPEQANSLVKDLKQFRLGRNVPLQFGPTEVIARDNS